MNTSMPLALLQTRGRVALGLLTGLLTGVMVMGCGPRGAGADAAKATPPTLSLGAEDVLTLGQKADGTVVITGAIQAERRADMRAEVASVVQRVNKDNGDRVRKGELLVKLDDTAIRDNARSAEEALRSAGRALDNAERQLQRLRTLQAQGMTSVAALDDAEVRRNQAQSEQVAAKARVVSAQQQLDRTEVRAPFDGVVSARKVSAGDTAPMGKELVQVIDPSSTRFEALTSAEVAAQLTPGLPVQLRVQGLSGAELKGRVRRVDAVAQPVTRQVGVVVDVDPGPVRPLAGLYAEGAVALAGSGVLSLPETALVRQGETTSVWVVANQQLRKRAVKVAARDSRTGWFPVLEGVNAGEQVLRSPGSAPQEGQAVRLREGA